MEQCPQCGSEAQPDPEHPAAWWCLACWHVWTPPREEHCPGRRPVLSPALRMLADSRDLRR